TEQSNGTSYSIVAVAIITLEVFASLWINAFIVAVLCIAWVKKKTLNSSEKILLVLGCCRFWFLCISWVYSFLAIICPEYLCVHPIFQVVTATQNFFIFSDLWVSASLCGFYCIKIANFRNSFFIYLKAKIDRIVPWLLLGSVVFSLFIAILAYDTLDKAICHNLNFTCKGIAWKASIRMKEHFFPVFFITGLGFSTSFVAVTFSALLLLFSLWRHKCMMQTNSMKNLSMDAHIKAMKSILSFFILYSINFIFLILTLIYALNSQNSMTFLIFIVQDAFPGVHSITLIFSNPKLEKTLLRIL
ncbi:Taste receptor type 2 member 7, partial [Acanthisitta chloris]